MVPGAPHGEALAVSGTSILAVGSNADIDPLARPMTRVIDLRGRTVIPGLIDAHAHLDREGLRDLFPSLAGIRSIPELQARLAQLAASRPPGEWIVTMPLGDPPHYFNPPHGLAERRWPTRWDLDAAAPDHPVYIRAPWGFWHRPPIVSIANSRALELAGVTARTKPSLSSITIEVDERRGEPTGIFREAHYFPLVELALFPMLPRFTPDDRVEGLRRGMARYAALGITSTYEGHGLAPEILDAYRRLAPADMQVRCHLVQSAPWDSASEAERFCRDSGGRLDDLSAANPWLHLDGIFLSLVGNRELNEALRCYLPYTGWAGFLPQAFDEAEYGACARLAMRHGMRLNTIDGWKSDRIVDIWARLAADYPAARRRRHVVEHLRRPSVQTLRTMKANGMIATTEPYGYLWKNADQYPSLPEAEQEIVPHRSLLEHGIPFALETDNCPPNPFAIMWSAVTRVERTSGAVLGPRQCISPFEALAAMTVGGALLCGREERLGALAPGKLADMVVLEENPLAIPADELRHLQPVLTLVGGRVVYAAPGDEPGLGEGGGFSAA